MMYRVASYRFHTLLNAIYSCVQRRETSHHVKHWDQLIVHGHGLKLIFWYSAYSLCFSFRFKSPTCRFAKPLVLINHLPYPTIVVVAITATYCTCRIFEFSTLFHNFCRNFDAGPWEQRYCNHANQKSLKEFSQKHQIYFFFTSEFCHVCSIPSPITIPVKLLSIPFWQKFTNIFYS